MNVDQLRMYVVRPTLEKFGMHSLAAENLVLGTCATESLMGEYIRQVDGPALGIYQMEPATHHDIYESYLSHRKPLINQIMGYFGWQNPPKDSELMNNIAYATLMCRIKYFRDSDPLPSASDIRGLANYWKRVYNSVLGKGTPDDFINKYNKYVLKKG